MAKIFLISCVSRKRDVKCPARELYISTWFSRARALAEQEHSLWFILSALHGLLPPDTEILPYNQTLYTMSIGDRKAWSERVIKEMQCLLPPTADEIVILAGATYREFLLPWLEKRYVVSLPMQGMRIGQQLNWLNNATKN